jgi:hypothetical protein
MRHAFIAFLLVIAACKSRLPYGASGYLGDYSNMKPSERYANQIGWQNPGADFADYDRLVIDPVLIQLVKKSPANDMDPAALRKVAESLRTGLVASIEPYYDVVKTGGAHTMRLQVVLTDVTPATQASDGEVSIEAEAVDTVTGTRLVAAVSVLRWPYEPGAPGLDPKRLEASYAEWGRRVVSFLDRQKAESAAKKAD